MQKRGQPTLSSKKLNPQAAQTRTEEVPTYSPSTRNGQSSAQMQQEPHETDLDSKAEGNKKKAREFYLRKKILPSFKEGQRARQRKYRDPNNPKGAEHREKRKEQKRVYWDTRKKFLETDEARALIIKQGKGRSVDIFKGPEGRELWQKWSAMYKAEQEKERSRAVRGQNAPPTRSARMQGDLDQVVSEGERRKPPLRKKGVPRVFTDEERRLRHIKVNQDSHRRRLKDPAYREMINSKRRARYEKITRFTKSAEAREIMIEQGLTKKTLLTSPEGKAAWQKVEGRAGTGGRCR